jgi:hypothetical protein
MDRRQILVELIIGLSAGLSMKILETMINSTSHWIILSLDNWFKGKSVESTGNIRKPWLSPSNLPALRHEIGGT